MTLFQAFRNTYGFTSYGDNRTAVTYDISLSIVIYICVLASIATLIAALGVRGRERWAYAIRTSYAVAICSIILVCLVGHDWQSGSVRIKAPYIYKNDLPFKGEVAIKVGLHNVNVSMDGYYEGASGIGYVYYSESIQWSDYGHESEAFQSYLIKGLPEPILKIIGFLTEDEGELRWARSYHTSGYFATVLLCASFAFWIISNVLLCSVVVYGSYMFMLTGLTMILVCVTYHVCQCPLQLAIRFNESSLRTTYGWCFWLTLSAGCVTVLLALVLIVADHMMHESVSDFFNLEKLNEDDSYECDSPTLPTGSGSIFLATCRIPRTLKYNNQNPFLSAQSELFGNSSDRNGIPKVNPVYSEGEKRRNSTRTGHRNSVTFHLQYVGEEKDVNLTDIEATLLTLQEDRKSEVKRRMSTTGSVTGILRKTEVHNSSEDESVKRNEVFSLDLSQEEMSNESIEAEQSIWQDTMFQIGEQDFPLSTFSGILVSDDFDPRDPMEILTRNQSSYSASNASGETTSVYDES